MSGGQFYLIDEKEQKHEAVFWEFSQEDLYGDYLEPGKPISRTTQFDVPYDEQKQYDIVIRPTKEQSTVDTAMICLTKCWSQKNYKFYKKLLSIISIFEAKMADFTHITTMSKAI